MPTPREFGGSFREGGPVTLVALVENAAASADLVQGDLTTWALRVFDLDHATAPDTPVWILSGQANTVGWQTVRATGSYARLCPKGYTFLYKIGHDEADDDTVQFDAITTGAKRLRVELEVFDSGGDKEVDGAIACVWLLKVSSRSGPVSA